MADIAVWRSRILALAIALTVNLIILFFILKTQNQIIWINESDHNPDTIITFAPFQDIARASRPKDEFLPNEPRAPNSTEAVNRAPAGSLIPLVSEPLQKAHSNLAAASPAAPASSSTSDVAIAVRKALQGLAACAASGRQLGADDQRGACKHEYAKAPDGLASSSFIDPLKRAGFDAVAHAQEAKRASLQGPIPDGYGACTGFRSNLMFGCPPPPRPKTPAANLWEASAPSTDPRGGP